MGVLEQVIELRNKGTSDSDIISDLKEQGISPKAIKDALSQAKIKDAVSSEGKGEEGMEPSIMAAESESESLPTEGTISDEDLSPPPRSRFSQQQQRGFTPMHQEVSEEEYIPQPQEGQGYPQYQDQQQESQQQMYSPQEGYEYQPQIGSSSDTDTIIEISEQVFAEKMKGALRQLESFNEFKTLSATKIENISTRLARLESSIDKLQLAILEKVGMYGRGLDSVKKEMEMMQDSFGKIVNTAVEKSSTRNTPIQNAPLLTTEPQVHRIEKKTTVIHKSQKSRKKKSKK